MIYTNFKGLNIPKLGFGSMRLKYKNSILEFDSYKNAEFIVDYAISNGINYFDSGRLYLNNEAEQFIGKVLRKYDRDKYILMAKSFTDMVNPYEYNADNGDYSKDQIKEIQNNFKSLIYSQLKNYNTDYFDLYLFHGISSERQYNTIIKCNLLDVLLYFKEKGIIKNIGFSFHGSIQLLIRLIDIYKWDIIQLQLNYLDWYFGGGKTEYEILEKNKIPCIVMNPLKGGNLVRLTGKALSILENNNLNILSAPSLGMRFFNDLSNIIMVLSGFDSISNIIENTKYISMNPLSNEEKSIVYELAKAYIEDNNSRCTNCRYCMSTCPQKLPIPNIISAYNKLITNKSSKEDIQILNKATKCLSCDECVFKCPQNIPISNIMKYIKTINEE